MNRVGFGRKLAMTAVAVICAACVWGETATMSLSSARQKIDEVIEDASVMTEVMEALSAEDQVKFLSEVNAAIARMPGSSEARTAALLNVDSAALRAAKSGNLANLVAEVFATATIESLPVLSERFAEDLFNRDASQKDKFTDEQFVKVAKETMSVVNGRTDAVDSGDVRSAFAALMFIRAANSDSDGIFKALADSMPEKSREVATQEWLPEALGKDGKEASYDALFAVANGGVIPDIVKTLEIAGPQFQAVLLSDLTGFNTDPFAKTTERTPITDAIFNPYQLGRPVGGNANIASSIPAREQDIPIRPVPPPRPYDGQVLSGRSYVIGGGSSGSGGGWSGGGSGRGTGDPSGGGCCCCCPAR